MKRLYVLAALLLLALAALAGVLAARHSSARSSRAFEGPPPGPYRGSEPPPGIRAPDFRLRSYRGRLVTMRALRGKVVLVTFLDTACTEQCPVIAAEIGSALPLLAPEERRRVAALAISVDPRIDTPARIRTFLRRRHALTLDFLTGSVRELRPVWTAFHVVPALDTGNADVHSADVRVFDRRGVWVSTLHAGVDLTPASLAHDVAVALRAGGQP